MSDPDGRTSKRIRTDGGSADPEPPLEGLARDEEFWLEDGNIVLVAGKRAFKIYRGLLAIQSPIFADLFSTANPTIGQLYDGCPVVRLSDSPEDLRHLLCALIPKEGSSPADEELPYAFEKLSSLTRLGHKYQIGFIERQAVGRLKIYFTDRFEKWDEVTTMPFHLGDGQEIEAVHLARLTDNLDMLPVALYASSLLGGAAVYGWTREDGTVETLDAYDLERCINGYGVLREETPGILSRIFAPIHQPRCATEYRCGLSISYFHHMARTDTRRHSHLDTWYSMFDGWMKNAANELRLCNPCLEILKKREDNERLAIWRRLPSIYGLSTPDGWGT